MWNTNFSLSLKLTLVRLIIAPLVLPFFLVYLCPLNIPLLNAFLALLFIGFGLTDFFDGYLARKNKEVTSLGGILDHAADKFLLYSTLIALVASHKIYFLWAIIWIGREFLIMTVRHVALEQNFSVPVSSLGKVKTVTQIIALALVITNPYQSLGFNSWWNWVEAFSLVVATTISLISIYYYGCFFIQKYCGNE
jgi:CDP-diacylglycerol--glycerol-3-phosphate 3-phosphatidyltransferase